MVPVVFVNMMTMITIKLPNITIYVAIDTPECIYLYVQYTMTQCVYNMLFIHKATQWLLHNGCHTYTHNMAF